ncbi:hypothetical protein [Streptomyces sp. enrichment culture]|uniref:hypothetical protein n=1 Tax=Streptomyces sp. enrichment culture TaxID=1795815 RepID=UPI003F54EB65
MARKHADEWVEEQSMEPVFQGKHRSPIGDDGHQPHRPVPPPPPPAPEPGKQ